MAVATLDPPDDDRPSWPDPGLDELASAQARRFRLIGRAWDQQEEAPALPVRTD
jgi:hypothetical protein